MSAFARKLVSKKKRRFRKDGFDLDMTYITDNIIAMGFPAEKMEGVYRNPMSEVIRYFDSHHKDHYKVYNLCSERSYDPAKFHGRVARYPFDDHNAPPFEIFEPFCADVHAWLSEHKDNVAVIHCKAGKGRTGVMICSYMVYASLLPGNSNTDKWSNPNDALQFYGAQRTENQKGVTIPSQLRYVKYFAKLANENKGGEVIKYAQTTRILKKITIHTVPKMSGNSCAPYFVVSRLQAAATAPSAPGPASSAAGNVESNIARLYRSRVHDSVSGKETKTIELDVPMVPVAGDIKIEFFHKDKFKNAVKMFHFWFNPFFIENNELTLTKPEIDKANKDKKHHIFDENLRIVIEFASDAELAAVAEATEPVEGAAPVGDTAANRMSMMVLDEEEDLSDDDEEEDEEDGDDE